MKRILIILFLAAAVWSLGAEAILSFGPGIEVMAQDLGTRGELSFAALGFQGLVFSGGRLGFLAAASFSFIPLGAELDGTGLSLGAFRQSFCTDMLWAAAWRIAAGNRFRLLIAAGLHGAQISLVHDTDPLQVYGRELGLGAGLNLSAHYRLLRRLLVGVQLKGAYDFLSYAYSKDPELASGVSLGGNIGLGVAF
jgi:hypothetical protein